MTEEPERRSVGSASELLKLVVLEDIDFYEVSGRRRAVRDDEVSGAPVIQIQQRLTDEVFEIRCIVDVEAPDATYRVDAAARFVLEEPLDVPEAVAKDFVERAGVMAVYPFVREAVLETSARLGAGRLVMAMMKAGRVNVDAAGAPEDASTEQDLP